jgi:glutaredoxin 2
LYSSTLSPAGITPIKISGRVDGIQEDCVVEHKQRRYRLFGKVTQRENIQLYVYMYLTGLKTSKLVETFGDKQLVHIVDFDSGVWDAYIARISEAVQELSDILKEEASMRRHSLFSVRE